MAGAGRRAGPVGLPSGVLRVVRGDSVAALEV